MTAADILARVQQWQTAGFVPPLACRTDPSHRPLIPHLDGDTVVLHCPDCDYRQTQIPDTVLVSLDAVQRTWNEFRLRAGLPPRGPVPRADASARDGST